MNIIVYTKNCCKNWSFKGFLNKYQEEISWHWSPIQWNEDKLDKICHKYCITTPNLYCPRTKWFANVGYDPSFVDSFSRSAALGSASKDILSQSSSEMVSDFCPVSDEHANTQDKLVRISVPKLGHFNIHKSAINMMIFLIRNFWGEIIC